jgi:hypothetical protein
VVDRASRDCLAELIHQLAAGRISNDQFEEHLPRSNDPAIYEVFWNGAWCLYDDLSEHRLIGPHRVPKDVRSDVARWVLFLKSSLEYEWPPFPPRPRLLYLLTNVATLGFYGRWYLDRWRTAGETSCWPFIRSSDLDAALKNPPYLYAKAS